MTYIFRTWKTAPDGSRMYAKDYGYRAWRIPVDPEKQYRK